MNTHEIGSRFETLAAQYLTDKGYRIVVRNFRTRRGEIDIIAKDDDTYVFFEVKYRTNRETGGAVAAVDRRKQNKIIGAARYYLLTHGLSEYTAPCRFDVLAIEEGRITHYENAFGV